ncbi:hypothetical protein N7448_007456 [Penicillium atrosanguineum]|uniref:Uncharacterized protein n=1 Tax=Penicillium atrosanguineum TaxID=1132637 RepID=A0A9W9UEZ4_9EURO|nr:uncharacterized protein N7443_001518 [Penicillium atrosanguineum]KAJ5126677.1 hypothetical protein N7448_007456 [Penicillium atrosanguineum]KAJ5146882.1 hypothetical protein N7526_000234 [Penicillium atrosanguineum]KAJ5314634.1 hypothetical protein N7443_001518 [Penicillium atrosanguineum]KAJ5331805.1 hypothetical protein N7476_001588 [Penicillium atrosanguineum]
MAESARTSAKLFLQEEVYRLGSSPGLRSIPPGPSRDFLLLTWGPVIYRTSYGPDSKRLLIIFLRCLNNAVNRSLHRIMTGSTEQLLLMEKAYTSKVFNAKHTYSGCKVEGVREAFRNFKASLAIPATDLPSRLRVCLMVDDDVLEHMMSVLGSSAVPEQHTDIGSCWVRVVEDNFPDARFGDQPYVKSVDFDEVDGVGDYRGLYQGWTMVALSALVEVFDGLRQMKYLVEYHREGRIYLGEGKWSTT